jgi:hypothetical protein
MISRRRMLAARVHLPLRQLALCLDCDECFEIRSPPDVPSLRRRSSSLTSLCDRVSSVTLPAIATARATT